MGQHGLVGLVRERARTHGASTLLYFVHPGGVEQLSFERLHAVAAANAFGLRDLVKPGDRAVIGLGNPREFVEAFFSLQFAGAIPVPIATPRPKSPWRPVEMLVEACGAKVAMVDATLAQAWRARQAEADAPAALRGMRILSPADLDGPAGGEHVVEPGPDDIAFLQFTSGSTGSPKGVKVTHGNLIHNQVLIQQRFGHSSSTVFAGWLPLYHDMGFIGNVLQPLYLGVPTVLLSPMAFLERPARLLQAISEYGATTCGMPNFGYAHCVDRVRDVEMTGLDLSSWQVAFNGAEPIRPKTLDAFADKFAACGFKRHAFYPCYGLAEATLFVTGWTPGTPWLTKDVASGSAQVPRQRIVSAGVVNPAQDIRIVDPESFQCCAPGVTGEIWIAGPCVAAGYWERPEETEATFRARTSSGEGPFLRTGDLGFIEDGRLFITGRLKDLIIIRGRNCYPQDIEAAVEACSPDFLPLAGASFMLDEQDDDRIVVVQEIRRSALRRADDGQWRRLVKDAVAKAYQINVADVCFVLPGAIPRTSSGKIQRRKCRAMYLNGELHAIPAEPAAVAST